MARSDTLSDLVPILSNHSFPIISYVALLSLYLVTQQFPFRAWLGGLPIRLEGLSSIFFEKVCVPHRSDVVNQFGPVDTRLMQTKRECPRKRGRSISSSVRLNQNDEYHKSMQYDALPFEWLTLSTGTNQ